MTKFMLFKKPANYRSRKMNADQLEAKVDMYLAELVVERIHSGMEKTHSLEQVEAQLELLN